MEPTTLDVTQIGQIIISVVVALTGFFGSILLLIKYSKRMKLALIRWFHLGCRNDSTMCVILGNSIIHRCEIAQINRCLPEQEREWLIKLMHEYQEVRRWNGVVKDRYDRTIDLPLEPTYEETQNRLNDEADYGRHIT